jgi:hypothetical protein
MTPAVEGSRAKVLLAALVLLVPIKAFAWGYSGHRIIAEIAEQFLESEASRQVRDLLALRM